MARAGGVKARRRSLVELERLRATITPEASQRKQELIAELARASFATPRDLLRFHETLSFLRAYPENAALLDLVTSILEAFDRRPDLRRFRRALASSGVAGTDIHFPFYWFTAQWLARKWPDRLFVDWSEDFDAARFGRLLPLLLPWSESITVDQLSFTPRDWLRELKGPEETDATFLIRRFETLPFGSQGRETTYDDLSPWLRLEAGPGTPSRSRAHYAEARVVFQTTPLDTSRPDLQNEARRPPEAIRSLTPAAGQRLIDLARESMVTRSRDLDVFENADRRDVRLIDCGGGLQFAAIGQTPERRALLESVYGFLTLQNGVPIGYVLASALFASSELAYNVFETYRGGESARIFGRVIAMLRALFDVDTFSIEPFQLGYGNDEGLRSGAWWFYYKLGFRPTDAEVRRVLREELARIRADRRHRSNRATLKRLASASMFLHLGPPRADVLGRLALDNIGLRLTRRLAARFGAERERGLRVLARETAARLAFQGLARLNPAEQLVWERWGPLIDAIPGVEKWSPARKAAAVAVIRARGGRYESEFVKLFDGHAGLRAGVVRLADDVDP